MSGKSELELIKDNEAIRKIIQEKNVTPANPKRLFDSMRFGLRRKVIDSFAAANNLGDCPVCTMKFCPHDHIINFGCHILHQVHEHCFIEYSEFYKRKNVPASCPICRTPVD